ncbi:hypothetical protein ACFV5G_27205 [Streptomyces sp. NPDC059766]|uniref:hypothetical protein n=1 Tax=Streptomyces sp. NPDC059766 TaxID=3346940 RepID=UPI0036472A7E
MQTDTGTQPTQAASPQRKPLKDLRGFWRILLAVVAPLPMIGMGLNYIFSPVDGGTSFEDTVATYTGHLDQVRVTQYLGVPFLVLLVPATFAVAWVSRRGAPRLTTAGAILAFLGQLAGFPLNQGGDLLAYMTAKNGLDVLTVAALQKHLEEDPLTLMGGLLFIIGIVFGLPLLGLALWRSCAAPAWMGIALALGGFTHLFMPGHIASGIGLLVAAVGFAGAGVALLRTSNDDFDLAPSRPA